jgi:hypothetical protein
MTHPIDLFVLHVITHIMQKSFKKEITDTMMSLT